MNTWIKAQSGYLVNLSRFSIVNIWPPRGLPTGEPKPYRVMAFNVRDVPEGGTTVMDESELFAGTKAEAEAVMKAIEHKLDVMTAKPPANVT